MTQQIFIDRDELIAEQREDVEIADLREQIVALQRDLAIAEGDLRQRLVAALSGESNK